MRQLVVRQIEDKVVRKLKERAGAHEVSMEEEHRRILREALLGSEPVLKLRGVLRRGILAVGKAGRPEHPRGGL